MANQLIVVEEQKKAMEEEKKIQHELAEEEKKHAEARKKFLEEIETKQEKYNRLLEEAREFAIDPDQLAKAQKKIREEVFGKSETQLGFGGLQKGSEEAYKHIVEAKFGKHDTQEKVEKNTAKTADWTEKVATKMDSFMKTKFTKDDIVLDF